MVLAKFQATTTSDPTSYLTTTHQQTMGSMIWPYQALCFLLSAFLHLVAPASVSSPPPPPHLCAPADSSALLQFKSALPTNSSASDFYCSTSYPTTQNWDKTTDCCSWEGVRCDRETGYVIGLDLSCSWLRGAFPANGTLFMLQHLSWLNLAYNDFAGSAIPPGFGRLLNLRYLNLSSAGFSGLVPPQISTLHQLVSLDLSQHQDGQLSTDNKSLQRLVLYLKNLNTLVLDYIDMSLVVPSSLLNLSSSLKYLSLSACQLQGEFPSDVFRLPNLQILDLDRNSNLTGYLPSSNWYSPLRSLDLSVTGFSGNLPSSIGDLKFLQELNLDSCHFIGSLPASIGNLTEITTLILDSNQLEGQIPDVFTNLNKLTRLSFYSNSFTGQVPPSLFNLVQLTTLTLTLNQLAGPLPKNITGLSLLRVLRANLNLLNGSIPAGLFTLPSLQTLDLSHNKFTGIDQFHGSGSVQFVYLMQNEIVGPVPSYLFQLVNLTELDISSNNLSGMVQPEDISKLNKLSFLNLSSNSELSLGSRRGENNANFTFPTLQYLLCSSCNVNQFPSFLRTGMSLGLLDLSNNKIQGSFSKWELEGWEQLQHLNLSYNLLTRLEQIPGQNLMILDLRSNLLEGPVPDPPASMLFFLLSDNKLTGNIPSNICNLTSLQVIDFSRNRLSGTIPECLGNSSNLLSVIDLRDNSFHGKIPAPFPKGSSLRSLNLNGNQLEGSLPPSLVDCSELEVLDVGNNGLNDTFPHWLSVLPKLRVLVLRSNRFHGHLSSDSFSNLTVIDLSQNHFSGVLQTGFLVNLKAMRDANGEHKGQFKYLGFAAYYDTVVVSMKGSEFELFRISNIFTTIDFSNNDFIGEIPQVVGQLSSLLVFNLSHNNLVGHIPASLGNLRDLESLDLSSNKLAGNIPVQLTSLDFLQVVNLSYNELVGAIPPGRHFDTFTSDSYRGNPGLCGFPLLERCGGEGEPGAEQSPPTSEDEDDCIINWKSAMIGCGCGVVFGLSLGHVVFVTGRPGWLVRMIESHQLRKFGRGRANRARRQ